jgi:hypothetical protein
MRKQPCTLIGILGFSLSLWIGLYPGARTAGQEADPLRVQAEVAPGPYHVGEGFELLVGVIAKGKAPKIDLPTIIGARARTIGTESRPISSAGIGRVVTHEYQYVVKFGVLPTRAGRLEIPVIQVQVEGRAGRSQPKRVLIKPVPAQGRPAEFLGGIGRFDLEAEASPRTVRVGQELDFRIKVTGPAAWGISSRPELVRYERPELGLRITAGLDQTSDEPPVRTFVYRLRPTRAGEIILPPVSIASFDPALTRYVTHVTASVPIRVIAVPSFDPTTIADNSQSVAAGWPSEIMWAVTVSMPVLLGAYLMLRRVRRRLDRASSSSPELARRYAKRSVRELGSIPVWRAMHLFGFPETTLEGPEHGLLGRATLNSAWVMLKSTSPQILSSAAHRIAERLSEYMKLGLGRPMGALTPDETREGVVRLTGSAELGEQAGQLTMRCDRILYGETSDGADDARELLDDARRLFEALGRVRSWNRNGD